MMKITLFLVGLSVVSLSEGVFLPHHVFQPKNTIKSPLVKPSPSFEQYFDQKLDHFNANDLKYWDQLYYSDEEYYKTGGPVYLWIGGGSPIDRHRLAEGYWQSHGKENNAMLFILEHRFYGTVLPLANTSFANLHYLKSSQAIEDIAKFIEGMNNQHEFPKDTKWIVFGAGYGGNLAAWLRAKYPNLVHGAVASSAPVLARLDFSKYLDNVADTIASHSKKCRNDIALANQKLDEMVRSDSGKDELSNHFRLCQPLKGNHLNVSFFMVNTVDYISKAVRDEYEGANVARLCEKMMRNSENTPPVERYAEVIDMLITENNHQCISTNYTAYALRMKKVDSLSSLATNRAWVYQLCTEFGWFHTSNKKSKTFSQNINLEFFLHLCSDIFDPSINKKFINKEVSNTNKVYGGLKINTSRILFVHGTIDPWRSLGVTSTTKNKNLEVILIKDGSHSSDLQSDEMDNQQTADAKTDIKKKLDSWLK